MSTIPRTKRADCLLSVALATLMAAPAVGLLAQTQNAAARSPSEQVDSILDSLDVTHLWLPKTRIHWHSGKTIRVLETPGGHTHCSAFVAVACEKMGVPMLSPPPQNGLANRQQDWLLHEGREQGWKEMGGWEAQQLANQGWAVVASFKNDDPKYHAGHGHIAVVRPSDKSEEDFRREGPQIIQAGGHNYRSTTLATGFRMKVRAVRFFAHARNGS